MKTHIIDDLNKLRRQIISHRKDEKLINPLRLIKDKFINKSISSYDYTYIMNTYNQILYYFSNYIGETDISKIEIENDMVVFITKEDSLKITFNGKDRGGLPFELINYGSYEKADGELFDLLLMDSMTILDIGANVGWFSMKWAKKFPSCKIYAFEPIRETYQYLNENIKLNNINNVITFNFGLTNTDGYSTFYFYPEASCLASSKNILKFNKSSKVECAIKKLDSLHDIFGNANIDFIKCDIEGGELSFLQGGINAIRKHLPILVLELFEEWNQLFGYTSDVAIQLLGNLGYECFLPYNGKLQKISMYISDMYRYNYFFLHKEKHAKQISNLVT